MKKTAQVTANKTQGVDKTPWVTIMLTFVIIILYLLGQNIFDLLMFDKKAILSGEVWRILTGHLVHCTFSHLFWNIVAFIVLGFVIETRSLNKFVASLLISWIFVSVWIFFGEKTITAYCGLSGVLTGLLVMAVYIKFKETNNKIYFFVLLATSCKIIFEIITNNAMFSKLSGQVIPGAHIAGFIGGAFVICMGIFEKEHKCFKFLK